MQLDEINTIFASELINAECSQGKTFVFGEGETSQPVLMLIGEAPGAQEVLVRKPFVGKAGKNLDLFLDTINQSRENIYITNAVKFRPTKLSIKGTQSNRTPSQLEQDIFKPWLLEEIRCIEPRLIVTLGNVPLRVLLGQDMKIGVCHGEMIRAKEERLFFPLYHPAAIIYNRSLTETYVQDLNNLKHFLSTLG